MIYSPLFPRINTAFPATIVTLLFSLITHSQSFATNHAVRDKLLASELEQNLIFGETLWLTQGRQTFLSIFTPDLTTTPQGAALILPDANGHPAWPDVIHPLQQTLPTHHWATLSISLPNLRKRSELQSYMPVITERIDVATKELMKRGLNNIVIIGYGTGATAAVHYLANQQPTNIRAFVGISLAISRPKGEDQDISLDLARITVPFLDVFAANDQPEVTGTAQIRSFGARRSRSNIKDKFAFEPFQSSAMATEPGNKRPGYVAYRQVVIPGADHSFRGAESMLSKRILGWLMRNAKGVSLASK